jgi:hypothetical protein
MASCLSRAFLIVRIDVDTTPQHTDLLQVLRELPIRIRILLAKENAQVGRYIVLITE